MYYEVVSCKHLEGGRANDYYLLVDCWLTEFHQEIGLPPFLTEDFQIQRAATGRRIIRDRRGWLRSVDGQWIDPETRDPERPEPEWAYEDFAVDLRAEFRTVIETTLECQLDAGWSGDRTMDPSKPLSRYGKLLRQRYSRPLKILAGDGVELIAIKPPPRELAPVVAGS